jgi:hypothetical protein
LVGWLVVGVDGLDIDIDIGGLGGFWRLGRLVDAGCSLFGAAIAQLLEEKDEGSEEFEAAAHRAAAALNEENVGLKLMGNPPNHL